MRFQCDIYRVVVHHRTVFIEATSHDTAHEKASQVAEPGGDEGVEAGWKHNRTELGVRFVKKLKPDD